MATLNINHAFNLHWTSALQTNSLEPVSFQLPFSRFIRMSPAVIPHRIASFISDKIQFFQIIETFFRLNHTVHFLFISRISSSSLLGRIFGIHISLFGSLISERESRWGFVYVQTIRWSYSLAVLLKDGGT